MSSNWKDDPDVIALLRKHPDLEARLQAAWDRHLDRANLPRSTTPAVVPAGRIGLDELCYHLFGIMCDPGLARSGPVRVLDYAIDLIAKWLASGALIASVEMEGRAYDIPARSWRRAREAFLTSLEGQRSALGSTILANCMTGEEYFDGATIGRAPHVDRAKAAEALAAFDEIARQPAAPSFPVNPKTSADRSLLAGIAASAIRARGETAGQQTIARELVTMGVERAIRSIRDWSETIEVADPVDSGRKSTAHPHPDEK